MSISSAGIGSGLDVESIIASLIAVESQPIVSLQQRKSEIDVKISAYGQIKSQLDAFQTQAEKLTDESLFSKVAVTSSDTDVLTVTADDSQAAGTYTVNVTNLAKAQILDSVAFADAETVVGEGQLNISSGSESFSLTIDSTNSTLAGIRDAINNSADNEFLSASIINTDGGSRLVLANNNTGVTNTIEITVTGDSDGNDTDAAGLSTLVYQATGIQNLNETQAAEDSVFTINGYSVTSESNSVSDVIEGITLNLNTVGTSTVTVTNDISTLENELSALVNIYNVTIAQNNQLKADALSGDTFLLSVERSLRNVINQKFTTSDTEVDYIFDLGLTFDDEGVLSLDTDKFSDALAANSTAVKELLTDSETGFAQILEDTLNGFTETEGIIDSKTDSFTSQIESIDDRILNINFRLNLTETRLRAQFTSLDTFIGSSIQTSTFLANNLSNFNFSNNNNNDN